MIDYILISSKWRSSVKNSRAYPSADIGSDHQLLIANIRLKLKAMRKHTTVQHFDIKQVKSDQLTASKYETEVSSRLMPVINSFGSEKECDVDLLFGDVVQAFHKTAEDVLGTAKHVAVKEWLCTETWKLVEWHRNLKPKKEKM